MIQTSLLLVQPEPILELYVGEGDAFKGSGEYRIRNLTVSLGLAPLLQQVGVLCDVSPRVHVRKNRPRLVSRTVGKSRNVCNERLGLVEDLPELWRLLGLAVLAAYRALPPVERAVRLEWPLEAIHDADVAFSSADVGDCVCNGRGAAV